MEPSSATLSLVGTVVAERYRIDRLLGEGGMGAVYLAEHTLMRKRVALKLLHADMSSDPEILGRFRREAQAAARISHPNVAAATDFGQAADGSFFLVLEYIEGTSLRKAIDKVERLTHARALHVARQIAIALEKAHDAGIIHRDLKPDNIMLVSKDGDPDFVKVLDFGIARIEPHTVKDARALVTKMGTILGTPEYMSPEQAAGETAGPGADIYSVGVMLYEMLSGDIPFDAEDRGQILNMHIQATPARMKGEHPPAIESLVMRLLAKVPQDRPPNAFELRREIEIAAARSGFELAYSQSSPRLQRLSDPTTDPSAPPEMTARDPENRQWKADDALAKTEYGLTSEPDVAEPAKTQIAVDEKLAQTSKLGIPGLRLGPLDTLPRAAAIAILGAPFFVFAFLVVVVISLASHRSGDKASDAGAGAPSGTAKTKAEHASAVELVNAKAEGAAALEALANEYPNDAAVQVELAKAYASAGRATDMLRVVSKLEPAAVDDEVLDLVVAAAQKPESMEAALAALEGPLGARGVDGLIELSQQKPPVRSRAQKALAKPEVRAKASPAASLFMDFKAARDCKAKHELLERVRDGADARILPLLRPLKKETGCGFLGTKDCHSCMRKDDDLDDAIRAVEGRTSKPAPRGSP